MNSSPDLSKLRGVVATVTLTGTVTEEYAQCREDMRALCVQEGFINIEWRMFHAVLVEAGRDAVVQHALNEKYDWLMQIDADATFQPDTLFRLLTDAYINVPDADVVAAYATLKGPPYLPTIDTGTGTWEEHYPGEGLLQVIRTGGHCFLAKTSAYTRFGPPWYRTRQAKRPVDAFAEIDNYARIKLHGRNPLLQSDAWAELLQLAKSDSGPASSVGEDSAFCDALLAHGGRIYVDTNVVTGHVTRKVVDWHDMKESFERRRRLHKWACGLVA